MTAIDIFEDRIGYRFLDEVDVIQDMPFSGFAVMALIVLRLKHYNSFVKSKENASG